MAVVKVVQSTTLVVKCQTGTNAAGNPVYANRSFTNVKNGTADADLYAVGLGLSGLMKYPTVAIERRDLNNLVNQ